MKKDRFYEIIGDLLYIYDSGIKSRSESVSIVSNNDFKYYKSNFHLRKIWSD